ncbi:2'-5' RNA ligase family protein [Micromonospora sp. Llam0]|uniref:2'-5' RNA ligase family protein n=1 Tax=Micromonospora sp. Llam0 TaxID=2485143 RepID=UPI001315A1AE|nr:2'-5' RNA ligase family protein [Micromonospora sp. Llam0]
MKPFQFRRADSPWPPGTTLLHVYVLVQPERDRDLTRLVDGGHAVLEGFPVSPVPHEWLHLTIDQITDRPAAEISQDERDSLAAELRIRAAKLAPFTVTVGSMLSYHSGVIADVSPDGDLGALYETVHEGIRAVRGDAAVRYPHSLPHLTIGYARAEADSDEVQRRLRRVRPSHATLTVDKVHLVDVTADAEAQTITWETVAPIALGKNQ